MNYFSSKLDIATNMDGVVHFCQEVKESIDRLNAENAERAKESGEHSEVIKVLTETNKRQEEAIVKLSSAIQGLQEINTTYLEYISDLRTEIGDLKCQVTDVKNASASHQDEFAEIRNDMLTSKERPEEELNRETEEVQVEAPTRSKKVTRLERDCTKLKTSVTDLKDEVTVRMKSMETNFIQAKEYCSRTDRLQKMFNNLHLSLQSRKDMGEEVGRLKADIDLIKEIVQPSRPKPALTNPMATSLPVFVPPPVWAGQHPSKKAKSHSQAMEQYRVALDQLKIEEDFIKPTKFQVVYEGRYFMEGATCYWVDGYDKVIQANDFMDPKSGIYTVPAKGRYDFGGFGGTCQSGVPLIYICSDRNDYRDLSWSGGNGSRGDKTLDCEAGDKVWLEVQGPPGHQHSKVTGITFTGSMALSEQSQKIAKLKPDLHCVIVF